MRATYDVGEIKDLALRKGFVRHRCGGTIMTNTDPVTKGLVDVMCPIVQRFHAHIYLYQRVD